MRTCLGDLFTKETRSFKLSKIPRKSRPLEFVPFVSYNLHSGYPPSPSTNSSYFMWLILSPKVWWQGYDAKLTASFTNLFTVPIRTRDIEHANTLFVESSR